MDISDFGMDFFSLKGKNAIVTGGNTPSGRASLPLMQASGIDGGIATGHPIRLRAAFKPTSSIGIGGRHDPCVGIRGAPVVEAMVALVLADHKLLHRGQCG